jgi:hypothetical protein
MWGEELRVANGVASGSRAHSAHGSCISRHQRRELAPPRDTTVRCSDTRRTATERSGTPAASGARALQRRNHLRSGGARAVRHCEQVTHSLASRSSLRDDTRSPQPFSGSSTRRGSSEQPARRSRRFRSDLPIEGILRLAHRLAHSVTSAHWIPKTHTQAALLRASEVALEQARWDLLERLPRYDAEIARTWG